MALNCQRCHGGRAVLGPLRARGERGRRAPLPDRSSHSRAHRSTRSPRPCASSPLEVADTLAGLAELGIVRIQRDRVVVLGTDEALAAAAISREAANAHQARDRLDDLAGAVPLLVAAGPSRPPARSRTSSQLDGELASPGGNALELLTAMMKNQSPRRPATSSRPDAWLMPRGPRSPRWSTRTVASGRRFSRGLPAARPARGARGPSRPRTDTGEEVRLIDEPADPADDHRRHPRHPPGAPGVLRLASSARASGRAWSSALTLLFELVLGGGRCR